MISVSASRLWLGSRLWCQGGQMWNLPWWWESVWNSERGLLQERGIRWSQIILVSCQFFLRFFFLGLPEHKRKYLLIQVESVLYCIIKLQLIFWQILKSISMKLATLNEICSRYKQLTRLYLKTDRLCIQPILYCM